MLKSHVEILQALVKKSSQVLVKIVSHDCLNDYMTAYRNWLCIDMSIFWNSDMSISLDIDMNILYAASKMIEKILLRL